MVEKLRQKNPGLEVYSVCDSEFRRYGEVLDCLDLSAVCGEALKIPVPSDGGSAYQPSIASLEKVEIFETLKNEYYGGMDIQIGLCWGYNTLLNALEYHKCTEINIAATNMLVFLGKLDEIEEGYFPSEKIKAFFVPKGTAIELYNDTLHYCPCQTSDEGFYSVVVLLKGTNCPLEFDPHDKKIIGKNKWVIWHKDAAPDGTEVGISGINTKLAY